ncbi:hypothetical protein D3C71_1136990 [compost metagenome]
MPPRASTTSTPVPEPLTEPILSVVRSNLASNRLALAAVGVAVRSSTSDLTPSGMGGSPGISRSPERRAMRARPARRPSNFRSHSTSSAMRRCPSGTIAFTRPDVLPSLAAASGSKAPTNWRAMAALITRLSACPAVSQRLPPPREP